MKEKNKRPPLPVPDLVIGQEIHLRFAAPKGVSVVPVARVVDIIPSPISSRHRPDVLAKDAEGRVYRFPIYQCKEFEKGRWSAIHGQRQRHLELIQPDELSEPKRTNRYHGRGNPTDFGHFNQ